MASIKDLRGFISCIAISLTSSNTVKSGPS